MKRTLMTVGLLTVLGLAAGAGAARAADVRIGVGVRLGGDHAGGYYPGGYYTGNPWRYGYDRGVREGWREGERDARRGERFAYYDERRYRDSDRGYRGWMGPRFDYERAYRRGFEEGYARAYRRYARHGWYDPYDDRERYDHRHRW